MQNYGHVGRNVSEPEKEFFEEDWLPFVIARHQEAPGVTPTSNKGNIGK